VSDELEPWTTRFAGNLHRMAGRVPDELEREAERAAATVREFAPRRSGALRRSIKRLGKTVHSDLPYAQLQSEGGVVRPVRRQFLTIPVRRGFAPGPGFVTVRSSGGGLVFRSGTRQLWAVRRREVRIRGSRYLLRALEAHMQKADVRVAKRLVEEVTR